MICRLEYRLGMQQSRLAERYIRGQRGMEDCWGLLTAEHLRTLTPGELGYLIRQAESSPIRVDEMTGSKSMIEALCDRFDGSLRIWFAGSDACAVRPSTEGVQD